MPSVSAVHALDLDKYLKSFKGQTLDASIESLISYVATHNKQSLLCLLLLLLLLLSNSIGGLTNACVVRFSF
jgi:hypothetical protein